MSKKIPITDRIKQLIHKSAGPDVNVETLSVYETIAINDLPVRKKGTLFDGAIVDLATMQEMAAYVNGGGNVPLHTMHEQGNELPVGKVFYSETRRTDKGNNELRSLFYIPNSETTILPKVDSGALEEVSIGTRFKTLQCSKCGFDYMSPEATWEHIYDLTCPNGHTIGENGTFNYTKGLDRWLELSLVSLGAANNAKIVGKSQHLLGKEVYNQLAATGIKPEATTLFASATKEPTMDLEKIIGQLTDAKAALKIAETDLAAKTTELTTVKAELTTVQAKVTELTAAAVVPPAVAEVQALLTTEKTRADAAAAFVRTEADRLCVALGETKLPEDATLATLTESISANRLKMADKFPVGGVSLQLNNGSGAQKTTAQSSSFKTKR